MPAKPGTSISDAAVLAATGKSWKEWFAILDAAGCRGKAHREIVAVVREHGTGPWWQQMVTVSYEQARGLRKKHEKPAGFEISRSKTIAAGIAAAFDAWIDARRRARWLAEKSLKIRGATGNKSIRITWSDDTKVEVTFVAKGVEKTQVSVQHGKLASADEAEAKKKYWEAKLAALAKAIGK